MYAVYVHDVMPVMRMCNNNVLTRASHAVTVEVLLSRSELIKVSSLPKLDKNCGEVTDDPFERFVDKAENPVGESG